MPLRNLYKSLYFQVIVAIILGVLLGIVAPSTGASMKPFGDAFIKLVKMIIAPIIFCTVVLASPARDKMQIAGPRHCAALSKLSARSR